MTSKRKRKHSNVKKSVRKVNFKSRGVLSRVCGGKNGTIPKKLVGDDVDISMKWKVLFSGRSNSKISRCHTDVLK